MILDEPLLGTEQRRGAWVSRAEMIMGKGFKNTVIGVLGGTGVGKSSLLNALLDEASVLPTSGSQGCTAAPIELRFNSALQQTTEGLSGLHVYTARVEFISQDDWDKELPRLVADICSNEDSFHGKPRSDEGKEAWQKLEHVYGSGLLHQLEADRHEDLARMHRLFAAVRASGSEALWRGELGELGRALEREGSYGSCAGPHCLFRH
jgi:ATPase subunit of ABC transporter with duplicated ATPase domains